MRLPKSSLRWCLRISISVHMFSHLLHDFSLSLYLTYLTFSLACDSLDHAFLNGPTAWYMTRDSLVSLIWVFTFRFQGGEIPFTILALLLTTGIWVLTAALKERSSKRKMEREARDKVAALRKNTAGNMDIFTEMYARDPKKAAEEFPELFEIRQAFVDCNDVARREWEEKLKDEEMLKHKVNWKTAWGREIEEAVGDSNAPKRRIEEVDSDDF